MTQRKKQVGARWIAKVRGAFLKVKLPERPRLVLQAPLMSKG